MYQNIPERFRFFLLGIEGTDALERVLEVSRLPEQALIPLSNVVMDLAEGVFPVEELDNQLASALSLALPAAAGVAAAVGREIFLPFKEEMNLSDLDARISAWEGKARVGTLASQTGPQVSPEDFVLASLSTLAPTVTDPNLKHRLELALLSYIRGERDAAATLALFMRAEKVGGLNLPEGEARALLAATDAALSHVRIAEGVTGDSGQVTAGEVETKLEPSPEVVLGTLLPRMVESAVFQAVLESSASEHSSRMMAMKNASEAAGEMIDSLTFSYNQARQAGITQEIAEISSGKAALES